MKGANAGCLFVFATLWCGFILVMDFAVLGQIAWEIAAVRFPTAPGVVTKSEVRTTYGSKGRRNYHPEISYRFTVDGREWTGMEKADKKLSNSRRQSAALKVAAYPVGAPVNVAYDPAAPASSILEPGLQPGHLHLALFLVPFNAIGFLLASPLLRHWFRRAPAQPLLETTDDLRMRVRLPHMPPWQVATIALGITAFLMMFALLAFDPLTVPAGLGGWAVVLGIAFVFGWRQKSRIISGRRDLFIDAQSQTVTVPEMPGRSEAKTVPFSEIAGLFFRQLPFAITYTNKWGMTVTEKNSSPRFEIALVTNDETRVPICRSGQQDQLLAIAHALRDTFGWPLTVQPR